MSARTGVEYSVSDASVRGWPVVRLTGGEMQVDVVPGKGSDIIAARWLPLDVDVLWHTPWGLRPPGTISASRSSEETFLESYPGGWQLLFPNAGEACTDSGVELGFHGEAALAAWDVTGSEQNADGVAVTLETRLTRSPFHLRRRLSLDANGLRVDETVTNEGSESRDVMWGHHPAFGAPFLSPACRVRCGARTILVDRDREPPGSELMRGAEGAWPHVLRADGGTADLSVVPPESARLIRFCYLGGFTEPYCEITNPDMGVSVHLAWDGETFPHAWYWSDVHGTATYPWHGQAYVLALEPASSYPGQLTRVRETTATHLTLAAGETRSAWVSLALRPARGASS